MSYIPTCILARDMCFLSRSMKEYSNVGPFLSLVYAGAHLFVTERPSFHNRAFSIYCGGYIARDKVSGFVPGYHFNRLIISLPFIFLESSFKPQPPFTHSLSGYKGILIKVLCVRAGCPIRWG